MKANVLTKTGLAIAVSGTLAACGGGGGGSGSDSPATAPLQVDPKGYGSTPVAVRQTTDFEAASLAYSDTLDMQDWIDDIAFLIDDYNYGWGNDEVTPEHCLEENGNLIITEEFSETRDFYEYRFEDCLVPGYGEPLRLDGRYVYDETFNSDGTRFQSKETFDIRGTLGLDLQPVAIVGTMLAEGTFRDWDDYSFIVSSPAMEYLIGSDYLALQGTRIRITEKPDLFTVDMQSKLVSSAMGGYLTLSTPVTLEEREYDNCPMKGHVVVSGDGKIEARYGETTARGHGLEILLNGSEVEYFDSCDVAFVGVGGDNSSPTAAPGGDSGHTNESVPAD